MKYLALCAALIGCKDVSPPIRDGKCVVSRYVDTEATNQTCLLGGYTFVCSVGSDGANTCLNMGEAVAERPKQ